MESERVSELRQAIERLNPWWKKGSRPADESKYLKRNAFRKAVEAIDGAHPVVLLGLHGTGKTTIVRQLIDELPARGVNPGAVLYLDFSASALKIFRLAEILEYLKKWAQPPSEPRYLFLDNPHYAADWSTYRETLLSIPNPWKLCIAAPSTAVLEKGARKKEPERLREVFVPPLSFREFLCLTGLAPEAPGALTEVLQGIRALAFGEAARAEAPVLLPQGGDTGEAGSRLASLFETYLLRGGFPTLATTEPESVRRGLFQGQTLERCVYRDMMILHEVRDIQELEKALLHFARWSAEVVNMQHLARAIGVSRPTLMLFFSYLTSAFLAFTTRAYSLNLEAVERSMLRTYIADSSLRAELLQLDAEALQSADEMRSSVCTAVFSHLYHHAPRPDVEIFYWKDPAGKEVDFVLRFGDVLVPVVVVGGQKEPARGLHRFLDTFGGVFGILLTRGGTRPEIKELPIDLFKRYRILSVPDWLFLYAVSSPE